MKTGVCRPRSGAMRANRRSWIGLDDLERPAVPGPVGPAGPDDDDLHPALRELEGDPLRLELAAVVGVLRVRGGVFVGGRAGLDRADDAGRADVSRLPDAGLPGRAENGSGSSRVDLQERVPGEAGGAEGGGQMKEDVRPREGLLPGAGVPDVAADDFDAGRRGGAGRSGRGRGPSSRPPTGGGRDGSR